MSEPRQPPENGESGSMPKLASSSLSSGRSEKLASGQASVGSTPSSGTSVRSKPLAPLDNWRQQLKAAAQDHLAPSACPFLSPPADKPEGMAASVSKPPIGIPTLPQHQRVSAPLKATPHGGVGSGARDGNSTGAYAAPIGSKARASSPTPRGTRPIHGREPMPTQPHSLSQSAAKHTLQAPPSLPHEQPTSSTTLLPTQSKADSKPHSPVQTRPRPDSTRSGAAVKSAWTTAELSDMPQIKVPSLPTSTPAQPAFPEESYVSPTSTPRCVSTGDSTPGSTPGPSPFPTPPRPSLVPSMVPNLNLSRRLVNKHSPHHDAGFAALQTDGQGKFRGEAHTSRSTAANTLRTARTARGSSINPKAPGWWGETLRFLLFMMAVPVLLACLVVLLHLKVSGPGKLGVEDVSSTLSPSSVIHAHTLEEVLATATKRSMPPQPLAEGDPPTAASVGEAVLGGKSPRPSLPPDASSNLVATEVQAACRSQSALSLAIIADELQKPEASCPALHEQLISLVSHMSGGMSQAPGGGGAGHNETKQKSMEDSLKEELREAKHKLSEMQQEHAEQLEQARAGALKLRTELEKRIRELDLLHSQSDGGPVKTLTSATLPEDNTTFPGQAAQRCEERRTQLVSELLLCQSGASSPSPGGACKSDDDLLHRLEETVETLRAEVTRCEEESSRTAAQLASAQGQAQRSHNVMTLLRQDFDGQESEVSRLRHQLHLAREQLEAQSSELVTLWGEKVAHQGSTKLNQVSGQVVNVLTMTLFLLLALVLPTWIQGTDHMWYTVLSVIDVDWLRRQWWWPQGEDCEYSVSPVEPGDVALRTGSEGQPAVQVIDNMEMIVSQLHTKAKALSAKQDFERHSMSGSLSEVHSQHAVSPSTKEEEHKARAWAEVLAEEATELQHSLKDRGQALNKIMKYVEEATVLERRRVHRSSPAQSTDNSRSVSTVSLNRLENDR